MLLIELKLTLSAQQRINSRYNELAYHTFFDSQEFYQSPVNACILKETGPSGLKLQKRRRTKPGTGRADPISMVGIGGAAYAVSQPLGCLRKVRGTRQYPFRLERSRRFSSPFRNEQLGLWVLWDRR